MTDTITIPLSKLAPWDGNVRRTGASDGIGELAASIAAHGLLQSLVVRKGKRGKYEVVAGRRRYLALAFLAKDGQIAKSFPVPCTLADDSIDATELSLAENVIRAPMHPADQFEAFSKLIEGGASAAEVAARFGVTETVVAKRMRLGRLSPVILNAYREAQIDLDEAQAFAVTDDREAQERVFGELSSWNRQPHTIRRALTADEIPSTDKRVRFVGLEAYSEAGGTIRQDLFCDDGTFYLQDAAILNTLVSAKLKSIEAEIAAEGWLWTASTADADHDALSRFKRQYPERRELSEADQAELDRLTGEYDELVDSDDETAGERLADLEERIDALNASAEYWPPETLALAGALVLLGYDGSVQIERGLIRKEDAAKAVAATEDSDDAADAGQRPAHSPRLVEDLTAQKTAAIGAALIQQPYIALAAVVHALALDACYLDFGTESCLRVSVRKPSLRTAMAQPDACTGLAAIEQERESLGDVLPGNPADLWDWCLASSHEELLRLLAFCAATGINAVQAKADRHDTARLRHSCKLAEALELDMTAWFKPTAEGYFSRINRAQILAAIDEAKGTHAPSLEKLKKTELAARAESLLNGTGWLPEPLRADIDANVQDDDDVVPLTAE